MVSRYGQIALAVARHNGGGGSSCSPATDAGLGLGQSSLQHINHVNPGIDVATFHS